MTFSFVLKPLPLAAALSALGLFACTEAPLPTPEVPAPILQNQQLRFPTNHPQLALIGTIAATPAKAQTVELPAKLVWNEARTQRVYPAFAGRVASIKVDVGQTVKAGALLAQLASPDFGQAQADNAKAAADVSKAEASARRVQTDIALAKKTVDRQRELFGAGIIARKELEIAEAELARSEADAASAGTDIARAKAEVQRASARTALYGGGSSVNQQLGLLSNLAGTVVERSINPGQELRPEQSGVGVPPLFVITDPSSLWVQIDARELDVGALQPGASFDLVVPALANTVVKGKVIASADAIDPTTRTIKVRGIVDNADRRLKSEMLASARVERAALQGQSIPASALMLNGTGHRVFVQTAPGQFAQREVEIGLQTTEQVVVTKGLAPGELVVNDNALLLARQYRLASEGAVIAVAGDASAATKAKH